MPVFLLLPEPLVTVRGSSPIFLEYYEVQLSAVASAELFFCSPAFSLGEKGPIIVHLAIICPLMM